MLNHIFFVLAVSEIFGVFFYCKDIINIILKHGLSIVVYGEKNPKFLSHSEMVSIVMQVISKTP